MELLIDQEARALYSRLYVAEKDLAAAQSFAQHLLKKRWHHAPWERRASIYMQQAAFTSALITSYARPFTKSIGWPQVPSRLVCLTKSQTELHKQLLSLRHQVYAHSDSARYKVRPLHMGNWRTDIFGAPFFRLTAKEVSGVLEITNKVRREIEKELSRLFCAVVEERP